MKFPLMSKALAMGGVVLGLMWSLGAVQDVVHEREARRGDAERSVVNSLAGTQTLLGPVLLRHCTETWQQESGRGADRTTSTEQRDIELALAPSTLKGTTSVGLEPRHRGLFKVNGYAAKAQVDVAWSDLSALVPKALHANGVLACDAPVMSVGVSDGRGIRLARLMAQGQELAVKSGTQHAAHAQGFHAALPPALVAALDAGKASEGFAGQLVLELAGTKGLSISPVADRSEVTMSSSWPHPSFGAARWLQCHLARDLAGHDRPARLLQRRRSVPPWRRQRPARHAGPPLPEHRLGGGGRTPTCRGFPQLCRRLWC